MPVEITVPEDGILPAWRIGAQEWRAAEAGAKEHAIYPMAESWTLYPPVSVPGAGDRLPSMPTEKAIVQRLMNILEN
jgi:hypothetical protein